MQQTPRIDAPIVSIAEAELKRILADTRNACQFYSCVAFSSRAGSRCATLRATACGPQHGGAADDVITLSPSEGQAITA